MVAEVFVSHKSHDVLLEYTKLLKSRLITLTREVLMWKGDHLRTLEEQTQCFLKMKDNRVREIKIILPRRKNNKKN